MADDRTDSERLELFMRRVDELLSTRLARTGGLNISFRITGEIGKPMGLDLQHPDEDDLRSFLLTLRQFVSKKEPVHLDGIYNLCRRLIDSDEIRRYIDEARKAWHNAKSVGSIRFEANSTVYPPDLVLDLWINGHYFHSDKRKEAELNRLDPLGTVFVRHLLLELVVETTRYILNLATAIRTARREGLLH